jgi:hypothetical protein
MPDELPRTIPFTTPPSYVGGLNAEMQPTATQFEATMTAWPARSADRQPRCNPPPDGNRLGTGPGRP